MNEETNNTEMIAMIKAGAATKIVEMEVGKRINGKFLWFGSSLLFRVNSSSRNIDRQFINAALCY